jgi:hypothetical protein
MEAQCGFTSKRGNRDGHFNVTVVREALFGVMRRYGLPDHFINILIRLHEGATIKVKIGEVEKEMDRTIGVRQGSCEGPPLFLFMIQAALETMEW